MNAKKKPMDQQERRRYVRIPAEYVVECERFTAAVTKSEEEEKYVHTVTKNFSSGGLLFESKETYDIGTLLKLKVDVPGWKKFKEEFYMSEGTSESPPLIVLAKVVRVEALEQDEKNEIGVSFSAIDEGHREALEKFVRRQTER